MSVEGGKMLTSQGVIVVGEASESEEEEEEFCLTTALSQLKNEAYVQQSSPSPQHRAVGQPHIKSHLSSQNQTVKPSMPQTSKPKYNSLLHQKLRESNATLARNITSTLKNPYDNNIEKVKLVMNAVPRIHTSTVSAHSAFHSASNNLTHTNTLLEQALLDNPLASLHSQA
ncbi:uncharacterized protein LOC143027113 [Oratosquilla oratoria]|uniref:uncharacterized protein LOC143027113 n=1 Tax=Oratosquilla oratoria TaxID=337810 RepID=UPI003F76EC40